MWEFGDRDREAILRARPPGNDLVPLAVNLKIRMTTLLNWSRSVRPERDRRSGKRWNAHRCIALATCRFLLRWNLCAQQNPVGSR